MTYQSEKLTSPEKLTKKLKVVQTRPVCRLKTNLIVSFSQKKEQLFQEVYRAAKWL